MRRRLQQLKWWWWRRNHVCPTSNPDTFAPIEGKRWTCPECGAAWIYEQRTVTLSEPAVWDRPEHTWTEPVTAWWRAPVPCLPGSCHYGTCASYPPCGGCCNCMGGCELTRP